MYHAVKSIFLIPYFLLFHVFAVYSQDEDIEKSRESILKEALLLYKLEKASWHGTDILLHSTPTLTHQLAGYLSYVDRNVTKTIFWNPEGKILFTVSFDSIANEKNGIANKGERAATPHEKDLIMLRNEAFESLEKNEGNFFTFYESTNPNLIPVITDKERTVFILTGSTEQKLLIGNDYKLWFNSKNEITKKVQLHKSLISLDNKDNLAAGSAHTHVLADQPFMTSTDICTFLLYKDILKMTKHTVVSDKYTSIFDTNNLMFVIIPLNNK